MAINELARWMMAKWGKAGIKQGAIALIAVLAPPIWPLRTVQQPWPQREAVKQMRFVNDGWIQDTAWMRTNTPIPSVAADSQVRPWGQQSFKYPTDSYGVLSTWDAGNLISALGNRTPVWSRWPTDRTARWFVCEDEAHSLDLLCPDCDRGERVRYIALDAQLVSDFFLAKAVMAGRSLAEYGHSLGGVFSEWAQPEALVVWTVV